MTINIQNQKFQRNRELKIKIQHCTKGFTLVELLIVMGIMVMVSMLVGSIFLLSLRGAKKSNAVTAINQNGLYALSVISTTIRNGQSFKGIGNTYAPVVSISPSNCTGVAYDSVQISNPDGNLTTLTCNWPDLSANNAFNIASTSALANGTVLGTVGLLNANDVNLVPSFCKFTCTRQNAFAPPVIQVQFNLQKYSFGVGTPGVPPLEENSASTQFSTTVSLRNNP